MAADESVTTGKSLYNWFYRFKSSEGKAKWKFDHPANSIDNEGVLKSNVENMILFQYEDMYQRFDKYQKENLGKCSVDLMHS